MGAEVKKNTPSFTESCIALIRKFKIILAPSYYFGLWRDYTTCLFQPSDPSSLAVFRICYGFLMTLDIPQERDLSIVDIKWGNPEMCHFPLIHSLSPLPYNWMCIMYLIMWFGAVGIMLGYRFHFSCLAFLIPFWYLLLLEKTDWNNHSYMFSLIALLLWCTNANACWSIDQMQKITEEDMVPYWNYFILRYQVFILYFMAGVKKANYEWLFGYSMTDLSHHWVFDPFKILLTNKQIDLWIVHICGFIIDASAGFGLLFSKTRPLTLIILFLFHFMNSRMFTIGMFPYIGIATMFIFCATDWPKTLLKKLRLLNYNPTDEPNNRGVPAEVSNFRKYLTVSLITIHVIMQLFLPFSHFITKDWVLTDKWFKHPDTVQQYARCAQRNLRSQNMHNISLYIDVWCSLNGRFHQRMFDPNTDLLTAEWSPFKEVSWRLPLLTELSEWREKIQEIKEEVYQWSNYTDVTFLADFPGFYLDNFISDHLINVTLTVLKGRVEIVLHDNSSNVLNEGESTSIPSNRFHQVHNILDIPSCYMYSYLNKTMLEMKDETEKSIPGGVVTDFRNYIKKVQRSIFLISMAILSIVQDYTLKLL